ncbi:MAG: signal recognition particle-docking protein FtsY [Bacilli bacterium]
MSFFQKLKDSFSKSTQAVTDTFVKGLEKTRQSFTEGVNDLFARYRKVDEDFFEELEELLIGADVGVMTVMDLIDELKMEAKRKNITETKELKQVLVDKMIGLYNENGVNDASLKTNNDGLTVYLFIGVNGVGKTTTIGKLAARFKAEGEKVMLAAGDTFRAGAVAQLERWAERSGVMITTQPEGSDPASVVFDAIKAAKEQNATVLLVDTAGRLQNKVNLMKELEKINRVIEREVPGAPHETFLVMDATTGQNGLSQGKQFNEVTKLTGLVLTKLDGTAKGGIVIALKRELGIPVKFVGLGEGIDDLQTFHTDQFMYGLFAGWFSDEENIEQ